jgi:hypothetical protein
MYYWRFISRFAEIAKPLTQLTEGKRPFHWSPEAEAAFHSLKNALCATPALGYPQSGEKFIVETDASNVGIGGVIAYFSKILSKVEKNYCFTRYELLAIVKTLEHFHKYLYGQQFHLRTDHSALQTARWVQRLQEYNFTSEHRQGRKHNNAYALSIRPYPEECCHCQRVEQRGEGLRVRVITTAAVDD